MLCMALEESLLAKKMPGKKATSTICFWASTIFSSAREFGSPWIGRRKELSNICMIILAIFLNEEKVFFWYYHYYYCIMKERYILYTISAHTCIKLSFCCILDVILLTIYIVPFCCLWTESNENNVALSKAL